MTTVSDNVYNINIQWQSFPANYCQSLSRGRDKLSSKLDDYLSHCTFTINLQLPMLNLQVLHLFLKIHNFFEIIDNPMSVAPSFPI
jgi:hypothetical protein